MRLFLSSKYPEFYSVLAQTKRRIYVYARSALSRKSNREIFTEAYLNNLWGAVESRSGRGSNLAQTKTVREQLPVLLEQLKVERVLDAACGDFHWMRELSLNVKKYIGGDIVRELIEDNIEKYEDDSRSFIVLDITKDPIPTVDLIVCRDCLVHLSFRDIHRAIENFKSSNSTYLLTTTFTGKDKNVDILAGEWRPLNLQLPPFNFPEPVRLINEESNEKNGLYMDKSLGLWKISGLG